MNQYRIHDDRLGRAWQHMSKAERAEAWQSFRWMLRRFQTSPGSQAVHRARREAAKQS